MKELLKIRERIKKKKPTFVRQDAHKKSRLGLKWRKPNGSDSKMRRNLKGYRRSVSVGWGSPKKVRGLHSSGLEPILIHSISEVEGLVPEKQGAIIASTVGKKKKVDIIKKAQEKKVTILNIKDTEKYLKDVEEGLNVRKQKRADIKKKKEKVKEKKEKEKQKTELEKKVDTEEDKKEEQKKEKDKLLTKREM